MRYFKNTTSLEKSKKEYRYWVKRLHPDKGGNSIEFNAMNMEYRQVLKQLETSPEKSSTNNALAEELKQVGLLLLKKQIPQQFLIKKANESGSPFSQKVCKSLVGILDELIK